MVKFEALELEKACLVVVVVGLWRRRRREDGGVSLEKEERLKK